RSRPAPSLPASRSGVREGKTHFRKISLVYSAEPRRYSSSLRATRGPPPFRLVNERRVTMSFRDDRAEQLLAKFAGDDPDRPATGSGISRRALLGYGSGTVVVAGVGLSGLLELLVHREAIAAGTVIPIVGMTREPDE